MGAATCRCCDKTVEDWVALRGDRDIKLCGDCLAWLVRRHGRKSAARRGGWRVESFDPIFVVSDVPRSAEHYRLLGFDVELYDDGYAIAHHDRGVNLHLDQADHDPDPGSAAARPPAGRLYLHVDAADLVAEEWRRAGLAVTGPEDMPWGKREGTHTDPDGNLIRFGSRPRT